MTDAPGLSGARTHPHPLSRREGGYADVVILGAGPAGSAAALALARAGRRPRVLERTEAVGDALCGGFLSWRTLAQLDDLGVPSAELGGHPVDRLRLFVGGRSAGARLPAPAQGVSRRRLDTRMNAAVEAAGVPIERGVTARDWSDGALTLRSGERLTPATLFLATGKHELRGLPRDGRTDGGDPSLGLRVVLSPGARLARELDGVIELHLFAGGYAGLVCQEDGRANLCLAARKSALAAAGGSPAALLDRWANESAAFADRMAARDDGAPDAIAAVPYGWRARSTPPGVFRLGDQAAVIPSLAGEGLGIAVASGVSAAEAHLAGTTAPDWQVRFARQAARPLILARLLRALGERPGLARAALPLTRLPGLVDALGRSTRILPT